MTNEEADELLANNPWAKWSDARELLQQAAELGAAKPRLTNAQRAALRIVLRHYGDDVRVRPLAALLERA